MASGKSTYLANHILDLILGAAALSAPANTYLALYTVAPTAGGGGTEATSGSYARASFTNNATNWPASSGGVKANGTLMAFTTATGDWSAQANMVALGILDASTSGNLLYFGSLTQAKPVFNGDTAQFAIGAITVTET